ncbi:hypothetical protein [Cellulomonas sp. ATA003]|uniref:hypothetical protein n=1 Tax=Cellulomonas sp. ATA003 TaxID=3073064 RepID=UPI0028733204|nr:hypothetical protein [Cellulomonas sp. ATA003]WNB86318.1 hypothetical protein REH70_03435 [Cellulomonas sp. ATA003]
MTVAPDGATLLAALDQRVGAAAAAALPDPEVAAAAGGHPAGERPPGTLAALLLPGLVALAREPGRSDVRWLLLVATTGAFPTLDGLRAFSRLLELVPAHEVQSTILRWVLDHLDHGRVDLEMTVVQSGVVVDVDHCARFDTHTGIHRVVRETIPAGSGRGR